MNLIAKVRDTIKKFNMFSPGDCVTVGFSGGKDSTALISVLEELSAELGISLYAVHINHRIRGEEAQRDENFVKDFCAERQIKLSLFSFDVLQTAKSLGISTEECGRKLRYEAFAKVGADKIATAHTLSDSAETMLFNLSRGSSLHGMCGIPPVRDNIVRPLIECTSAEILEYLYGNAIPFVTDSTNSGYKYSRNRIRNVVIPELKSINSGFESNLKRASESFRRDDNYLSQCADALLQSSLCNQGYKTDVILNADLSLQYRAVSGIIKREKGISAEYMHIESIVRSLSRGGIFQINGGVYVRIRKGIMDFPDLKEETVFCIPLQLGVQKFFDGVIEVSVKKCEQIENLLKDEFSFFADYDKISGEIVMRSREPGDSFYDSRRRCTKKIKNCFNELAVPPEKRCRIPIFTLNGKVIGFLGSNADASVAADRNTKNILCIKYRGI